MALVYDDIVVGAGSSGAVLAARLSEDPERSVLLLEAGPDYTTVEQTPSDLLDARHTSLVDHDWHYTAEAVPGREIAYPRGRVMGGCSAVNATVALRGLPSDFDTWAKSGNPEWSWDNVLPAFRTLEDDQDEEDELHGTDGPVPIRRWKPEELRPFQRAYFEACRRLGFPEVRDHNDPQSTGVGVIPMNQRALQRISTAISHLLPARPRLNLTIRPDCLVHRVLFEDQRAVGVEVECGRVVQRVYGRRVTLAAGAIASPALLVRSGIGPSAELRALGIEPLVDLPGVGAELVDHPRVDLAIVPKPGACDWSDPYLQVVVRYTAPGSDVFNDMQLYIMTGRPLPDAGIDDPVVLRVTAALQEPRSRGRLVVRSRDPHVQPRIELNYAADPEDLRRLVEGVRLSWRVARSPELAPLAERVLLLDEGEVASDAALQAYVRANVGTIFHPVGTARMGPEDDAGAVVDQYCRVRGIENLRVVDASIMPSIVRCNTNLTCIMIAERVADWMRVGA